MTTASDRRGPWRRRIAVTARWLHIYLSMGSFALILFFATTGLTLNHPDWFANRQRTSERHGIVSQTMLHTKDADGANKLGLVELLRAQEHVRGTVTDFRVDDQQISISFRSPGYTADAFLDRTSGKYDLTEVNYGFVAVVNDLHKGHDAGRVWSAVIDVAAVVLVLVSLTGLVLIWFVYKRRTSGLALAGMAALVCIALWRMFVK